MDAASLLDLLLGATRLKWIPRTGWAMRGVPDPESVAEHAWGVTFMALILVQGVEEPIDREKLLTISLLHDLPEARLSDISSPALEHLPPEAKRQAERGVLKEMLASLPEGDQLLSWWEEYEAASTLEGRLVRDADRLEMLLQSIVYEESRGAQLDEFWEAQTERPFYFDVSRALYQALHTRRDRG